MWNAIKEVLLSPNVSIILCFVMMIVFIGVILSRSGLMHIHTSAVEIGAADRERNIIRQQIEYVKLHYEGMESIIDKPPDYNPWRGKFIMRAVFLEFVEWITLNHLTTAEAYVEIKQDRIVDLVHSLTIKEEFRNEAFDEFIKRDVKDVISKLVQIRNIYKKGVNA